MVNQPTKIGKYDIVRVIGRGGMGMVYQAIDPTIGRMVAIKKVTAVLSDDPDLLKRFYREAQSTGKLQHPNIVTLHDLGDQDGVPYLVMEYLEGDSLEKIIRERRPFPLAEKLNIIIQACEGLAYAHHRQIIHRDVKPGNIVVLNDGGVKIVDFGIAQFGNERYTRTGQVIGSLYYMSPEQIQDADIDSRSDIYSTGVVLFEFLAGSLPFQGKDPTSTLARILHEPPPPLTNFVAAYPAELDEIIRRALAKDRNTRYTSMEDFAFDLRSVQETLSRELIAGFLRAAENSIEGRDWDKAREQLRQILNLDKQHRRANELMREVQVQIHRQQLTEQVRQLRIRADEALSIRNWDEALALLDQAVKIDGSNTELVEYHNSVRRSSALLTEALRRAETAHDAGDLEAAKRAVEEALSVDPSNTTAKALNAILAKEISERSKRKKVDDLVVGARKEIALRHFTSALELLRSAESVDPSVAEVQQLIRSATAGREHERRRQALEKACGEIEQLLNRDEYSAACDRADEALRSFPQDLGLLKLKGFAEKQREAWTRHQFIESQIAAARELAESGQFVRAQAILNEVLDRYPDDSGVISLLGVVTDGIARQEAQRREAERQAGEKRHYIRVQLETAGELLRTGQTAQALKKIREAISRYPDSEELRSQFTALEGALAREEVARERAEQEARQRKSEIEKMIADSWQLLSNKQTGQAVVMLDQALRRHPNSEDLKSQLEFAQRRLAVEQAERERAEQEVRRRRTEILKEVASAQHLLDSRQAGLAVAALERALGRYSDSDELRSLLQFAQRRLAAEQADQELAEQEARQKQAEIQQEIVAARELLDAKWTGESVARLEQAQRRYPGSEEVRAALEHARQQLAAEEEAREKTEEEERRRRAWIDAEITLTRQWMDGKQVDRAVTSLQQAVNQYPESEELKAQLESAVRRLALEQVEREQAEREAQRRRAEIDGVISTGRELMESKKTDQAVISLEKAVLKFPDSEELRSQFELAKRRFVQEEGEKERTAEEQRLKRTEIEKEILSARQLLESRQAGRAVAALELVLRKYPDSTELKSQLDLARQRLAAEEAERKKAAQEARRKQNEVEKEIAIARNLLDAGNASQAVASLEESLRRIPDSADLKSQLESAKKRVAAEEAERQRSEQEKRRKHEEIAVALAAAKQSLDSNQTGRAMATLEQALRSHPDSEELKGQLAVARKRFAAEQTERERAEHEARRRQAEVDREIAAARQLLDSNQTGIAVTALEEATKTFPDSKDLKTLLESARQRVVREEAEKRHAEEEAKKRQAEIEGQIAAARQWLDSNQTTKAEEALQLAVRKYPESEGVRVLLVAAQERLKHERAEQEKAERAAHARRQGVSAEVEKANRLLKAKQTAQAVAALEEATRGYPESDELRSLLSASKQLLVREAEEREQAEKRQAQLQTESAKVRSLMNSGQPEQALQTLDGALRTFGKDPQLQQLQESVKAAVKVKKAEEKKREAESKQAEAQRRQRDSDLGDLRAIAESASAKPAALDKMLRRAGEIAARYPNDAEIQQSLVLSKSALESLRAKQKAVAAQHSPATKLSTPQTAAQAEVAAVPARAPGIPKSETAGLVPRLLNKWTALAVLSLVVAGVALKYFGSSKKPAPVTYIVTIETQPAGAQVRVGDQACVTPGCRLSLPAGNYVINAELQGYKTLSQSLNVNAQEPGSPVTLALVPTLPPSTAGYLVVRAGIEGADVLINGNQSSQTAAGGSVRLPLVPGQYTVEVRKKGYVSSKPVNVAVSKGKDIAAEFNLRPLPTSARLLIAGAAPNLQVFADGHYLGLTGSDGSFSQSVDPGDHDIAVEKDGGRSNTIRKTFVAGQPLNLDGKQFVIAAVRPSMASVVVKSLPPGATIKVEGTIYRADASGAARFEVPPGTHTLEFTADGYKPKQVQRSFASGESPIEASLERIDTEGPEWAKLSSTNDMAALQGFLNKYPSGNYAAPARSRLDKLIAANQSEPELRAFSEKFPKTPTGEAAGKKAESFRLEVELRKAEEEGIQTALDKFNTAFQHHQGRELKDIWPSATNRYLEGMHPPGGATFVMMLQRTGESTFSGTTAAVPCVVVSETTIPGRPPTTTRKIVKVRLYKADNRWLISEPFSQ